MIEARIIVSMIQIYQIQKFNDGIEYSVQQIISKIDIAYQEKSWFWKWPFLHPDCGNHLIHGTTELWSDYNSSRVGVGFRIYLCLSPFHFHDRTTPQRFKLEFRQIWCSFVFRASVVKRVEKEQVPQGNNDASRLIYWLIDWLIDWFILLFLLSGWCW